MAPHTRTGNTYQLRVGEVDGPGGVCDSSTAVVGYPFVVRLPAPDLAPSITDGMSIKVILHAVFFFLLFVLPGMYVHTYDTSIEKSYKNIVTTHIPIHTT